MELEKIEFNCLILITAIFTLFCLLMLMLRALTDVRTTTPRLLLFWSRYLHLISVQQQFGGCLWTVFFIEIFWIPVIFCVYFVNNAFVFFLFHFFLYSYAVSYSPYYRHMLSLFYHVHYILLCSALLTWTCSDNDERNDDNDEWLLLWKQLIRDN